MKTVRREEPMEMEIGEEPTETEKLWQHLTDGAMKNLPEERSAQKERAFQLWCFNNGVNAVISAFLAAAKQAKIDPQTLCVVSGIGCLKPIYEALRCDCFHVHQGRSVPFSIGLHLANPSLKVVTIGDESDLLALGGNHIIHAARRNLDMMVIGIHSMEIDGQDEYPFNLPYLMSVCGVAYFARWTILNWDDLCHTIAEGLDRHGFRFIEFLCPLGAKEGLTLQMLRDFERRIVLKHFASPEEEGDLWNEKIVVGKFVDQDRPTFLDMFSQQILSQFG